MKKNKYNSYVLLIKKNFIYAIGDGFSENGQYPFLDKVNLESGNSTRIYKSPYKNKYENIIDYDIKQNELLVRIESPNQYPNYYKNSLKSKKLEQLTFFENPFESLKNVKKENFYLLMRQFQVGLVEPKMVHSLLW